MASFFEGPIILRTVAETQYFGFGQGATEDVATGPWMVPTADTITPLAINLAAPLGSFAMQTAGQGVAVKTGALATDWTPVVFATGANTWTALQTFQAGAVFEVAGNLTLDDNIPLLLGTAAGNVTLMFNPLTGRAEFVAAGLGTGVGWLTAQVVEDGASITYGTGVDVIATPDGADLVWQQGIGAGDYIFGVGLPVRWGSALAGPVFTPTIGDLGVQPGPGGERVNFASTAFAISQAAIPANRVLFDVALLSAQRTLTFADEDVTLTQMASGVATILAAAASVVVAVGAAFDGDPAVAVMAQVDATATQVLSATWDGFGNLTITANAAATGATNVFYIVRAV